MAPWCLPADAQHLEDAALGRADEFGVGLDAVDDDGVLHRQRVAAEIHRHLAEHGADLVDRHRGDDRRSAGGLGHVQPLQDGGLPVGRGAAVAAHGRNDRRSGTRLLQPHAHRTNDDFQVIDPAAAHADRHPVPGADAALRQQAIEFAVDRRGHILDRLAAEVHADAAEFRKFEISFDEDWVSHSGHPYQSAVTNPADCVSIMAGDAMRTKNEKPTLELFKGVMLAHLILALHAVLICLIGLVVIFFGGIARYWGWIFLGGLGLAAAGAFLVYRRLKTQGSDLMRGLQGVTLPSGSTLEVRFLGGVASVKFARDAAASPPALTAGSAPPLLEGPESQRLRELAQLAQLYEKNLITREEFDRAKGTLLSSAPQAGFGPAPLKN
jgi:hypothetical protein